MNPQRGKKRKKKRGSAVPPYDFLNLYGVFNRFSPVEMGEKRPDLKSLKGQTKAEELGDPKTPRKQRNRGCTVGARAGLVGNIGLGKLKSPFSKNRTLLLDFKT
jgi:hypothetical protein